MSFDARTAKLLTPGSHITIDDSPGLRLKATSTGRAWIYRYKSPLDGLMKQIKIGLWPSMSIAAATVEWERLRSLRDAGRDPGAEKREARSTEQEQIKAAKHIKKHGEFTVMAACDAYYKGHILRNRKDKGAKEARRIFDTMLDELAEVPAVEVTRSQAFDLLDSYEHIPVQCQKLRAEMGAVWDYNLDAGKLPESTPNWWRQIKRGRIKSKGKKIAGVSIGTAKRWLTENELIVLIPWLPNFSRNVADVLTMYLWTATRGSEIVSMRVEEVTVENDNLWWTIPKEKTKNARHDDATDLRVPLIGRAAAIVKRRIPLARNGFIFWSQSSVGYVEQKAVQSSVWMHQPYSGTRPEQERPRLPITHWTPHDLRRTSRTVLASLGCPTDVAESILGHMQDGIKGIYNRHTYDKERLEWLSKLSNYYEKLLKSGS